MKDLLNNKLVWLAVIVVAVVGIWLGTKGDDKSTDSSKSSGTSLSINKEAQDKCLAAVNDKVFCKFAGAFANIGDYKVNVTSNGTDGSSVIELANAANGNSLMVSKVNGVENANVVVFNGVTFAKDPADGQWIKFSATSTSKPEAVDRKKEFLKADYKNDSGKAEQYVNKGTEACGSLTCYKYQIIDPDKPNDEGFLWFDNSSYLLRRISSKDSNGTTAEMTFSYESVNITEPTPVKETVN